MKRPLVVFTNGVWDVLHLGHKRLLEWARLQGSHLIIGVNSDASVERIRGLPPINPQAERVEMLSAYTFVNEVIVFDEDSPEELIRSIRPNVIVKGPEYRNKIVAGSDVAEVRFPPWGKEHSSGDIVARVAERLKRTQPTLCWCRHCESMQTGIGPNSDGSYAIGEHWRRNVRCIGSLVSIDRSYAAVL